MRRLAFLLVLVPFLLPASAHAQRAALDPRYGAGFDGVLSAFSGDVLPDGLGIGVRGRVSFPINADFSLAAGAGIAGFVFSGRDDATYVFNPQLSGILTLPRMRWAQYLLGGFGGYFPMGASEADGGPAIHFGVGWARPLQETSLYVEFNPAIIIGSERSALVLPARVGVIF